MEMLTLKNDKLEVEICPQLGASIAALRYNLKGRWVDIMRPTPQEAVDNKDPGGFASFQMMPYSNRIENGKLKFNGKVYHLKVNTSEGHTIHGDVRDREWKVLLYTDNSLELSFHSRDYEDINWPFPFSCKLSFALDDNTFITSMSIKNEGDSQMPAGFGAHPYFLKKLTEKDERVVVKLATRGIYPGSTPIPTGSWIPAPKELDFSTERVLDDNQFVDNCYRAKHESTIVRWPGSGVAMTIDADDIYKHIVFYTPLHKEFFAIEPVTNCNNGFNMAEEGIKDTGTIYLNPGEEASGDIKITIAG